MGNSMFPRDLLQAINDWQSGGNAKQKSERGKKLREEPMATVSARTQCKVAGPHSKRVATQEFIPRVRNARNSNLPRHRPSQSVIGLVEEEDRR